MKKGEIVIMDRVKVKKSYLSTNFIMAGSGYNSLEKAVPAPYFRRCFEVIDVRDDYSVTICGLGFYELYINGIRITKGYLAPYISSPDDVLYYDTYDIAPYLHKGKNCIGVLLGNGFFNNPGGYIWDFDKAVWRGAPRFAIAVMKSTDSDEENELLFEADEQFRTIGSPIRSDDYRIGEEYDARLEIRDWNLPEFDDSTWSYAIHAETPRGEKVICTVPPVIKEKELAPVSIIPCKNGTEGYLFDFGENNAGVCRLKICGKRGQKIILHHGEHLINGKLDLKNLTCDRTESSQRDVYILAGKEEAESYQPVFTYHGFRYVWVEGLTKEQACKETLTYIVMHSRLEERGNFKCSDDIANKIQEAVRRSTLSNFYYFPTDCPQREKNGWTADAALSAEHTLLNLNPEMYYREWLRNIRKAQADNGALPGIVPTAGWGFKWGNGPAWDCVLVWLPYYVYRYRKDKRIIEENSAAILRYLHYLTTRMDERGLLAIGLGDWCQVSRECGDYEAPLIFTDSVLSMDICKKAVEMFEATGDVYAAHYADEIYKGLYNAIRLYLIDRENMMAEGNCETTQAMAIYYGLFNAKEREKAFENLLSMIHESGDVMNVGVLGGRVLFHVLSESGYSELAYEMITRKEYPSYGNWITRGATTLWEEFYEPKDIVTSLNHHFWGDVSHWFISCVVGICYVTESGKVEIRPSFIKQLAWCEAYYEACEGRISVRWEKNCQGIVLQIIIPDLIEGKIYLEDGYQFMDGSSEKSAKTGQYEVVSIC